MVWGNRIFAGMIPRISDRQLPENAAILARNCWLDASEPRPLPVLTEVDPAVNFAAAAKTIFRFDDTRWFVWNDEVSVVRAPVVDDSTRRTIWTGQGAGATLYPRQTSTTILSGFVSPGEPNGRRLGIPAPVAAPGAAPQPYTDEDMDMTAEFHTWVYTYVSDLGEEGPPSPPSAVVERGFEVGGALRTVRITTAAGIAGYNLQKKRIYRSATGASGVTTYRFLTEITLATLTYDDSTQTAGLAEGIISTNWDMPKDDLQGIIELPNGILAAFREREVHFSEPYQPHAWPEVYIQVVDSDIVAIENFGTTLVVLTTGRPHLISGSHPAEMYPTRMELNQPCVSAKSVAHIAQQGIVYASPDGLVQVGPGGGEIISKEAYRRKQWQALEPENINAAYHDTSYIAFLEDSAVAFDPELAGVVQTDDDVRIVYLDEDADKLYVVDADNTLKEWRSAAPDTVAVRTMRWKSRLHIGRRRTFSAAQVIADGYPVTFRLFVRTRVAAVFTKTVQDMAPFRLGKIPINAEWYYEIEAAEHVKEVRIGAMNEML